MMKRWILMTVAAVSLAGLAMAVEDGMGTNHVRNLHATQSASVGGNLTVQGVNGTTVIPNVQFVGYTKFGTNQASVFTNGNGSVYIAGNTEVAGTLWVQQLNIGGGTLSISNLQVLGVMSVNGNVTNGATVTALSNFNISSNVVVGQNITVGNNLTVTNNATIGGTLAASNTTITGTLVASGKVTFSTDLSAGGNVYVGQSIVVTNNATVGGSLALGVWSQTLTAPGNSIDATGKSVIKIGGTGGISLSSSPQITGGVDGQILVLQGTNDVNWVLLSNNNGLVLEYGVPFKMGAGSTLHLIYDAATTSWKELSRQTYGGGSL